MAFIYTVNFFMGYCRITVDVFILGGLMVRKMFGNFGGEAADLKPPDFRRGTASFPNVGRDH